MTADHSDTRASSGPPPTPVVDAPSAARDAPHGLPSLHYLDRYRNEGTRSYSEHAGYSEAHQQYQPTTGLPSFELPLHSLPRDMVNVYLANPAPEVTATYLPEGSALFPIHPQVLSEQTGDPYVRRTQSLGIPCPPISVSPSSSTRTLYVRDHPSPHALKVHFPFRVSRYGRRMRDEVVAQAVAVSNDLEQWMARRAQDPSEVGFAFLREVLGVTHQNLDTTAPRGEHWGYLVRDMRPFPALPGERALIPGFALYGGDYFKPTKPPLLLELIARADAVDWVLSNVLLPIVRHWVTAFVELGFILEPHGQNVLLEMAPDGGVARVVHRDLSVGIDMRRRRHLDLPDEHLNGYNRMEDGTFNSIAYDKFMGGHFFDALVKPLLKADPSLDMERFRAPCRVEFARIFPEHRQYFPSTVQYFSEERDEFGKPSSSDTGKQPDWRP